MSRKYIIGIDLGGTNLKAALLDLNYRIRDKDILDTRKFPKPEELIFAISFLIGRIISKNNFTKSDILGIGLGLPGPIDSKNGIVHFFPNIPGFKEVKLKRILERKLKLPVFIDNDAKLMCLAEYKFGAAKGSRNALCLTLGTGVGGGLIIEGELYRGLDNASGEIGHMPISEDGPRCNCGGRGCLEAYIGNNRILAEARKTFGRRISLEELSGLAKKNNSQAKGIWMRVGRRLGVALVGAVNLLNLDVVVIGGGVSKAGSILFEGVRRTVKEQAMNVQARHVKILKAKLGYQAGMIGAAILVIKKRSLRNS